MIYEQIVKAFAKQLSLQIFDFLKNLRLEVLQQTSLKKSSIALVAMMFFEQIAKAFAKQLSLQIFFSVSNFRLEVLQ